MYKLLEYPVGGPDYSVFPGEREYDQVYINAAQNVRLEGGNHYDGTLDSRVGVAMRVVDRYGREYMVTGPNYHEGPGSENKRCAEGNAADNLLELRVQLGLARDEDLTIKDIYIAATNNEERLESINGLPIDESAILDPCGGCRTYFAKHPSMSPTTRIVSVTFNAGGYMVATNVERFEDTLSKYSGVEQPATSARPTYALLTSAAGSIAALRTTVS